ncbi:MAG TPA: HD domain-containing phosphohydrolase [Planctomycetota bacterium]
MSQSDLQQPPNAMTEATLVVDALVAAFVNSRIYAVTHPRVQSSIASLQTALRELAAVNGESEVVIGSAEGLIIHKQSPLLGASIGASRLLDLLRTWQSGGIQFDAQVDTQELETLLLAMAARPQPGHDYNQLNETLAARQCRKTRLLPPYSSAAANSSKAMSIESTVRVGLRFYQSMIDMLQNVTVSVCRGGRIDFGPVQAQAEQMLKSLQNKDQPLLGLARQDQYDAFTFGHSLRVAVLSINFARTLTDDHGLLIRIGTAALLHDVGKSLIPLELLHSTRQLSAEERVLMNRHAELGAECLLDHNDSDPLAVAAAFGHHRSTDGSGYPRTLHDHHISMVSRIVKICDVFEALTAARPYKQPMSPIRAYRVMLAMGDKLDQRLLRKFIDCNGIYPNGQVVQLTDGTVAVVHSQGKDPLHPVVALPDTPGDDIVVAEDQRLIDLGDIECCGARSILCELTPTEAQELARRSEA